MAGGISFLGASCTGKTSVFELVKKDRSLDRFEKIDSITRELVREGVLKPPFDSVANQKMVFDKYLAILKRTNFISDRSVLDVHTFTKTLPASVALDVELNRQLSLINLNEYYLGTIFYFPIYWEVEDDGERMADAERRKKWDQEIRNFLITKRLPYEVIPKDTPYNRLKFIKSVLNTRFK